MIALNASRHVMTLAVVAILLAGCGVSNGGAIVAVTPLPTAATASAEVVVTPTSEAATATVAAPTPAATPTPLSVDLPSGSALAVAQATDAAMQPTPRSLVTFDQSPVSLRFDEFYDGYNIRSGLILSDKLVSLDGQEVVIEGYMAPPLKPELDWFVLTRIRLEYCPFCSTAADWPDDIAVVYLNEGTIRPTEKPLRLRGRLEVGPSVDPETGMVSLVRIYANQLDAL
ncbi:MAG: hypothetical protein H3C34_08525 [Caldilineaceae bacterium]|nr:hypothetical protein [Caldilineaceae bacterium]